MKNNIKLDVEIIDQDDNIVSGDTFKRIDYSSLDIDHISLKQLLTILKDIDDKHIEILNRDKNFEFQYKYDLSKDQIVHEIKNLTINDYIDGPVQDDNPDRKHPLWIFKKYVQKVYCYIKLKLINKGRIVIVVSFHEDESR